MNLLIFFTVWTNVINNNATDCSYHKLLYLPTQIRFLIGGERVTCHWSKLNDALGRTKLNDALGQQHLDLELLTCTWSCRAPWNRGKFVSYCSHWSRAMFLAREPAFIIQEKGFITEKIYQINKGDIWTFCISKLLIWRQKRATRVQQHEQNMLFLVNSKTEFSS